MRIRDAAAGGARRAARAAARHPDAERRRRLARRTGARARHGLQRPRGLRRAARGVGGRRDPGDAARARPGPRCAGATRVGRHRATRAAGRRVVILGLGSIGTAIADRLRPFGVEVIGVGRTARDGVRGLAELDEVLRDAEILVNILPLTSETAGLLDARRLGLLPDGALVVNAGRGRTIDTAALVEELRDRSAPGCPRRPRTGAAPARPPALGPAQRPRQPAHGRRLTGTTIRAFELAGDQVRRFAARRAADQRGRPLPARVTEASSG